MPPSGSIMQRYMDKASDPCSDFYSYACGNWKNFFKIPPDRSSYDTFEIIRENLDLVLNDLLTEKLSGIASLERPRLEHLFRPGQLDNNTMDATLKAKLFYQSCMDELSISKRAHQPLVDVLRYLGGWPIASQEWGGSREDLFVLLARKGAASRVGGSESWLACRLRLLNNDVLISQWVGPDMKNANQYVVHVDQTSLGLPTRDYFLDPKNIKYVRAYKILIMGESRVSGRETRLTFVLHVSKRAASGGESSNSRAAGGRRGRAGNRIGGNHGLWRGEAQHLRRVSQDRSGLHVALFSPVRLEDLLRSGSRFVGRSDMHDPLKCLPGLCRTGSQSANAGGCLLRQVPSGAGPRVEQLRVPNHPELFDLALCAPSS